MLVYLPSMLWCCWLGGRKGILPVKKLSGGMLAWLCVWIKVQIRIWPSWCHCHCLYLAPVNPDWFYVPGFTFLVLLTRVVADKIQKGRKTLCVCVRVCVCVCVCVTLSRSSSEFNINGLDHKTHSLESFFQTPHIAISQLTRVLLTFTGFL